MTIDDSIKMLSEELRIEICKGNFDAIEKYIQIALVVGLEQPKVSHNKRIIMLDKNNNVISKFDRLVDAANFCKSYKELKSKIQTIYIEIWKTLNDKKNTSYGYHWKYA